MIGHGIDIVEFDQFRTLLDTPGDHFRSRCFTAEELRYAGTGPEAVSRLAARFAAKEAVLKALGTGWRTGLSWKDIEISNAPSGAPLIRVSGGVADLAAAKGIDRFLVSLSHSQAYAIASVIAAAASSAPTPT